MRTAEREAAIREESLKEGIERGIKTSIEILRDMGESEQEILTDMLAAYPDYAETVRELMQ